MILCVLCSSISKGHQTLCGCVQWIRERIKYKYINITLLWGVVILSSTLLLRNFFFFFLHRTDVHKHSSDLHICKYSNVCGNMKWPFKKNILNLNDWLTDICLKQLNLQHRTTPNLLYVWIKKKKIGMTCDKTIQKKFNGKIMIKRNEQ